MVFCGLSAGPWAAGVFLSVSQAAPNSVFYIAVALRLAILCYILLLCPESLDVAGRAITESRTPGALRSRFGNLKSILLVLRLATTRLIAALISPIAIFRPRSIPGKRKKDYNLTFVGAAIFVYLISITVYQLKYLYAQHVYSWSATQLGYYMSLLWISRAVNLLILLPIIISYFKPKPRSLDAVSSHAHISSDMLFDKRLAQCSFAVDGLADFLIVLSPAASQVSFVGFSCLSSFTSGGNPAVHSLGAVCLHAVGRASETGALFGAMAVLGAIAHTISPTIYALTYSSTVAYFPKAIFCLASALLTIVVLCLGGVSPIDNGSEFLDDDEIDETP